MTIGDRRPPLPRPLQPQHRGEPFLPVADYKPKPKRPANIGELYDAMCEGFEEVGERFDGVDGRIDALAVRVKRAELDAWRRRIIIIGKTLAPAALGWLAHYVPDLPKHTPAILDFLNKLTP